MKRIPLVASLALVALVALIIWSAGRLLTTAPAAPPTARPPALTETPGPPTPCVACVQAALASLAQEDINLRARQAQAATAVHGPSSQALVTCIAAASTQSAIQTPAMFKANSLWNQVAAVPPYAWDANARATANAMDANQGAVQAETDRQQARLQLTSNAVTQSTEAAAAQRKMGQVDSRQTPAIAMAAFQAQSDVVSGQEPDTLLWMWLTPLLIIGVAVLAVWGVTRGLAQRGTRGEAPPR